MSDPRPPCRKPALAVQRPAAPSTRKAPCPLSPPPRPLPTLAPDRRSLLLALLLFGLLVLLATLGRHWGWIRSFGGDLLAVVWLYYLMGSALRAPAAWLASAAFAVGALLELGQYLAAQLHWQFSSPVLRIVLGSTADGFDLLAYALGALLAWWLERRR
ncbi:Protein of uncharacterised function (DUF2809) [Pseudomonas aeruginosa]|nr:DUF2809 domain-containing protein [Pseudomonas aeruginosa]CAC9133718.1 Protein of uncharacterised function (DUF2809) [Pseudomonas aeruginosa]